MFIIGSLKLAPFTTRFCLKFTSGIHIGDNHSLKWFFLGIFVIFFRLFRRCLMVAPATAKVQNECNTFKVVVVGAIGTGKTSLIKRITNNEFNDRYKATIGVDFILKRITLEPGKDVLLQFWDIAGQERFGGSTRQYYKDAVAALLVFDATRSFTLEEARRWKQDIDSKAHLAHTEQKIPTILLANKIDLISETRVPAFSDESLTAFVTENECIGWMKTSAKTGVGVIEAVQNVVQAILGLKLAKPQEKAGISLVDTAKSVEEPRCSVSCS